MRRRSGRQSGNERHVHGEARLRAGRLELSRSYESLAKRLQCDGRRRPASASFCSDTVPLVSGRMDRSRSRIHGLLRADGQFVQTLSRPVSWAPTRLAWSHDNRTASFRVVGEGSEPAHRMPHPGSRLQPLSMFSRRRSVPAWTGLRTRSSRRHSSRATCMPPSRCRPSLRRSREAAALFQSSQFVAQTLGAGVAEHYAHFFELEQAAFRLGRDRLGTQALLRADLTHAPSRRLVNSFSPCTSVSRISRL